MCILVAMKRQKKRAHIAEEVSKPVEVSSKCTNPDLVMRDAKAVE